MNSNESKFGWGTLAEVPQVCVNRFGSLNPSHVDWSTSRAFFMTHFDDEMCRDVLSCEFLDKLEDPSNDFRLYLHVLMMDYLKFWVTTGITGKKIATRLEKLKDAGKIVFLTLNENIVLHFKTSSAEDLAVEVSTISSGSNIGCVMLLFEVLNKSDVKRILFTGDCRLTMKDLKSNRAFRCSNGSIKKLSKIYLDTTYCFEEVAELPPRIVVTKCVAQQIKRQHKNNEFKDFEIMTRGTVLHLGFVYMLLNFLRKIRRAGNLNVPSNLKELLKHVPIFRRYIGEHRIPGGLELHLERWDEFSWMEINRELLPNGIFGINLGCEFSYFYDNKVMDWRDDEIWRDYKLPAYLQQEEDEETVQVRGIYSSNLSRHEAGRLVNFFGVDVADVIPLHKSPNMTMAEFREIMKTTCADCGEEQRYFQREPSSDRYDFTTTKERNFPRSYYDLYSSLGDDEFQLDYQGVPKSHYLHRVDV